MAKVELPLIRKRDHRDFGTLTLIRTDHTWFTDRAGHQLPSPQTLDPLIALIRARDGEEISYHIIRLSELDGPVVAEPTDDETTAAEISELLEGER